MGSGKVGRIFMSENFQTWVNEELVELTTYKQDVPLSILLSPVQVKVFSDKFSDRLQEESAAEIKLGDVFGDENYRRELIAQLQADIATYHRTSRWQRLRLRWITPRIINKQQSLLARLEMCDQMMRWQKATSVSSAELQVYQTRLIRHSEAVSFLSKTKTYIQKKCLEKLKEWISQTKAEEERQKKSLLPHWQNDKTKQKIINFITELSSQLRSLVGTSLEVYQSIKQIKFSEINQLFQELQNDYSLAGELKKENRALYEAKKQFFEETVEPFWLETIVEVNKLLTDKEKEMKTQARNREPMRYSSDNQGKSEVSFSTATTIRALTQNDFSEDQLQQDKTALQQEFELASEKLQKQWRKVMVAPSNNNDVSPLIAYKETAHRLTQQLQNCYAELSKKYGIALETFYTTEEQKFKEKIADNLNHAVKLEWRQDAEPLRKLLKDIIGFLEKPDEQIRETAEELIKSARKELLELLRRHHSDKHNSQTTEVISHQLSQQLNGWKEKVQKIIETLPTSDSLTDNQALAAQFNPIRIGLETLLGEILTEFDDVITEQQLQLVRENSSVLDKCISLLNEENVFLQDFITTQTKEQQKIRADQQKIRKRMETIEVVLLEELQKRDPHSAKQNEEKQRMANTLKKNGAFRECFSYQAIPRSRKFFRSHPYLISRDFSYFQNWDKKAQSLVSAPSPPAITSEQQNHSQDQLEVQDTVMQVTHQI